MLQSFVFMSTIEATIRNTKTKGDISSLRIKGSIPAIIYGGSDKNQKISLEKNRKSWFLGYFSNKKVISGYPSN